MVLAFTNRNTGVLDRLRLARAGSLVFNDVPIGTMGKMPMVRKNAQMGGAVSFLRFEYIISDY